MKEYVAFADQFLLSSMKALLLNELDYYMESAPV